MRCDKNVSVINVAVYYVCTKLLFSLHCKLFEVINFVREYRNPRRKKTGPAVN